MKKLFWLVLVCVMTWPVVASAGYTLRINIDTFDTIIVPRGNGMKKPIAPYSGTYPSRDHFGQFIIVQNTGSNLTYLMRAIDTTASTNQFWEIVNTDATAPCVNAQWCLRVTFNGVFPGFSQDGFCCDLDWKIPAAAYKTWASQQAWYRSHGKIATNQLAHVESCATNAYTYFNSTLKPVITAFGNLGSKRVGCFITQYRTNLFDVNYPNYTCSTLANCKAWWQSLKDTGNGFALPYINAGVWDSIEPNYNAANTCKDAGGNPVSYGATSMRLIDPKLSTWPQTLYDAWAANTATDGSLSEGIYLDYGTAAANTCYYSGVADQTAWITGIKAVLAKFTNQIIMAEGVSEPYIPYVDINYLYPPLTDDPTMIGLYGYIYGGIPGYHIVGVDTANEETPLSCYGRNYRARTEFNHSATLYSSGFACDLLLAKEDFLLRQNYFWNDTVQCENRTVRY